MIMLAILLSMCGIMNVKATENYHFNLTQRSLDNRFSSPMSRYENTEDLFCKVTLLSPDERADDRVGGKKKQYSLDLLDVFFIKTMNNIRLYPHKAKEDIDERIFNVVCGRPASESASDYESYRQVHTLLCKLDRFNLRQLYDSFDYLFSKNNYFYISNGDAYELNRDFDAVQNFDITAVQVSAMPKSSIEVEVADGSVIAYYFLSYCKKYSATKSNQLTGCPIDIEGSTIHEAEHSVNSNTAFLAELAPTLPPMDMEFAKIANEQNNNIAHNTWCLIQ